MLFNTSALTTLLLSASVAVRPKKFSAKAAPPPAVPPPATVPAKDLMLEVSRASTVKDAASTTKLTSSIFANTVEVKALVVLEPAKATAPPPAAPAAIASIAPEVVASTFTCPGARTVLLAKRAVTSPPISLTATAAPPAPEPPPLTLPAKEKMSLSLSALTVKAPPSLTCNTFTACALTLAVIALVVKLPLTAPPPETAAEAATDLIMPVMSASTRTAAAACKVMPDKFANTALPTLFTANAAPTAAEPEADTLLARVSTEAPSWAWTVSELPDPYKEPPLQVAVMSSSSQLVVLAPVTAALPPTPTAIAIESMLEDDKACTSTAPSDFRLLLSTSALTCLLLSSSVAVRPKKFSAMAAPPPPVPPTATDPANDSMVDVSRARTVTVAASSAIPTAFN